ncbi:MAG: (Fe-S)-binding protein [Deltaproteobacteria bacterium]|nr:(Fe-S)-binding protein [Deltaproteobacteria bacterium]
MSPTENVLFAMVFTALGITFLLSAARLIRMILLGQPDHRLKGEFAKRFKAMLLYAFGQKRVVSYRPFGFNHFFLFWGFMILFLANAEFAINGLFPSFSLRFLGPTLYSLLTLAFDVVSLGVLICVGIALFRRLVLQPSYIEAKSPDALIILGLVAGLMIASFGLHGSEIAAQEMPEPFFMPITKNLVAPWLRNLFEGSLPAVARFFWWLHAIIFLVFLNYLPHSKHLHILASIPNCYTRSFESMVTLPREEFSVGKSYGVSRVDEFSWKDLLDFMACTECGRCNENCPATQSGKTLNPRYVIRDGRTNLRTRG